MAFGDFTVVRSTVKYVLNSSGVLASVAVNTPAFEYNTDGTYRGLLVEPAATNQIRNNTMAGAVAGSPGTLPTNWTEVLNGLTRQVVATGTQNGVNYIDLRFSGTASSSGILEIRVDGSPGSASASVGQTWTNSAWMQVIAQPSPADDYRIVIYELNAGGGFLATNSAVQSSPTTFVRRSYSVVLSQATVAFARPVFGGVVTSGDTYDFTIRIGWPQMETGSVATSPIVTTGSTVSRTADSVSLTGASSLIGQTANTLYIEGEIVTFTGASDACIFALTDGTNAEAIVVGTVAANGRIEAVVRDGGVDQATIASGSFATGVFKCAIASAVNDVAFYLNGSSVGTDAGATHPALSVFQFGGTVAVVAPTARPIWFKTIADFTSRIANAQLATMTTL